MLDLKFLVVIHLILFSYSSFAQDTTENSPKFNFEIGAGFHYSPLKDFNAKLNSGGSSSSIDKQMQFGYSLNLGANYDWKKALSVGVLFEFCNYSISQYKSDLSFEDPMAGGPNYTYDLKLKKKLRSIRFGLSSTLFFDQIHPKKTFSRINYGIYLDAFHGIGQYQDDRIFFQWGQGQGDLTRTRHNFNYTNTRYGLAIALNFKDYQNLKILLRTGIQHTLQSDFKTNTFSLPEVDIDFTGVHSCLSLRLYFRR